MASDPFDFSDVFRDLENKIDEFMRNDDTKEVASRMFAEMTETEVYDKYTPKGSPKYTDPGYPISRRYDKGGLMDWHNYHVLNIGKMNMTVINETKGNWVWDGYAIQMRGRPLSGIYYPSEGWDPGYINDIIEEGIGYNWRRSEIYKNQPYPRPFMEKACDKFVDDYLLPTIHSLYFDD